MTSTRRLRCRLKRCRSIDEPVAVVRCRRDGRACRTGPSHLPGKFPSSDLAEEPDTWVPGATRLVTRRSLRDDVRGPWRRPAVQRSRRRWKSRVSATNTKWCWSRLPSRLFHSESIPLTLDSDPSSAVAVPVETRPLTKRVSTRSPRPLTKNRQPSKAGTGKAATGRRAQCQVPGTRSRGGPGSPAPTTTVGRKPVGGTSGRNMGTAAFVVGVALVAVLRRAHTLGPRCLVGFVAVILGRWRRPSSSTPAAIRDTSRHSCSAS